MAKVRNGRGNKKDRYVALPHYIMDTFAWLEFARIHNGANNGRIAMSSRTLGERLGVPGIPPPAPSRDF
jgi:hypothetical protein